MPSVDGEEVERWIVESQETLQDCRVFSVDVLHSRRASQPQKRGATHDFFAINSPDFVNVVALTERGECVLVEQWRHGAQAVTLEIPGGLVDAGESPETAARRELLEETGFSASQWLQVGQCLPNAAIQTNRCTTFLALGATRVADPSFDDTEHCVLHLTPWPEVVSMVRDGRIDHALVVAAVLYARLQLASA